MCGSLKRENNIAKVGKDPQTEWTGQGNKFLISDKSGKHEAIFNAHAQGETITEKFTKHGWKHADLLVSGYEEQGRQYEVPKGYVISIITRDIPRHGKIFNIITREARNAEKEVHSRFPIMRHPRF